MTFIKLLGKQIYYTTHLLVDHSSILFHCHQYRLVKKRFNNREEEIYKKHFINKTGTVSNCMNWIK